MASFQEFLNKYNTLDHLLQGVMVNTKFSMVFAYALTLSDPIEKETMLTLRSLRNTNAHGVQPTKIGIVVDDSYISFLEKHIHIVNNPGNRDAIRNNLIRAQNEIEERKRNKRSNIQPERKEKVSLTPPISEKDYATIDGDWKLEIELSNGFYYDKYEKRVYVYFLLTILNPRVRDYYWQDGNKCYDFFKLTVFAYGKNRRYETVRLRQLPGSGDGDDTSKFAIALSGDDLNGDYLSLKFKFLFESIHLEYVYSDEPKEFRKEFFVDNVRVATKLAIKEFEKRDIKDCLILRKS